MLNVNVINAKNTQKVEVKPGQPANLKVDPNTRFELVDSASGKAPAQIKARRVGDNLEIVTDEKAQIEDETVSNAQKPDLVLENYYKQADVSLFAGAGQEAVSYVPVDGAASGSYAAMNTSATTGAALGVLPLLNPLLGAAVVGAGAVVATNANGSTTATNQSPVAQDAVTKVTENKIVSDKVPTATDADGTVASYRLVSGVAAGELTFNADGSYSFEANKDFDSLAEGQTRTVSFTYSAVDNAGGVSAPKTVTITVTGVNDAPVAIAASKSVDEGIKVTGFVSATDADAGATLKYALVGAAPAGLTFKDDGTYSFDASDVAYDSLKFGETKDVVVKFKANDGTVDSAEQTLKITVMGKDDAAKITGSSTGSLTEDAATTTATGSLSVTDVDAGQAKVVVQTDTAGTYGKFSVTESGKWTYTLDNGKANVQALNANEKATETFTVKSADGTVSQDVVVTITGVNDAATITGSSTGSLTEDAATSTATGSLSVTDVDAGQAKVVVQTDTAGTYGKFSVTESGKWTYTLDNSKAAVQALGVSEKATETFTVRSADGSASQDIKVTIIGANDVPVATYKTNIEISEDEGAAKVQLTATDGDTAATLKYKLVDPIALGKVGITLSEIGELSIDTSNSKYQELNSKDDVIDLEIKYQVEDDKGVSSLESAFRLKVSGANDAPVAIAATNAVDEGATVSGSVTATDADAGAKLKFALVGTAPAGLSFKDDGTYSFDAGDAAYDSLKAGEKKDVVVKFKANDGMVDSAEQTLTITVKGAAEIEGDSAGAVIEDASTATATGTLTVSGADAGQTKVVAQTDKVGNYGKFSITESGKWTYTLDNGKANVQALNANEKATETFTVKSADGTASQDVVVTITGVNDAATITGTSMGSLTEDGSTTTATGSLSVSDADAGQSNAVAQTDTAGTFGKFSIKDTGECTYTLDNSKAAVQALGAGENMTDTFTVKSADGSASQDVVVTITGVNDAPEIQLVSSDSKILEFQEADVVLKATGTLTIKDKDVKDVFSAAVIDLNFDGTTGFDATKYSEQQLQDTKNFFKNLYGFGVLSVQEINTEHNLTWGFTTRNSTNADLVPEGETLVLNYTIQVKDKSGAQTLEVVTVKIIGSNDAPVARQIDDFLNEGEKVSGSVIADDPDGDLLKYSLLSATPAGFTLKDDGTYSFDANNSAYDNLNAGESKDVVVKFKANDGKVNSNEGTLTITVDGKNDAPVATATTNSVDEGATVSGSVTATDADAGATLKFALVGAAPAGLSFKDDGNYSFDAGDAAYDSLKAGETKDVVVKFKANDGTVDSAEQTLTITVTGANDAPTISVQGGDKDTGSINENDTQEIAGSLTLNDVDADGWTMHGVGVRIGESSTFDYLNQFSAEQQSLLSSKLLNLFTLNAVQNAQLNQKNNQQWSFKSENASDFDFLPVNKTLVVEYVVSVTDAHEESTTHIVSITITGKNDAPVVQLTGNDSDRADLTETNSALSASGTVSLFDMDLTDEVNYVISDVALNTTVTSFLSADDFAIIKEQVKGFMTLEAIGYLNDGNNLQWTFDSTGDSHSGFIPAGQTLALDYTVTATDKSGEIATQVIHINILGTNAIPLIEFKGTDSAAESLIETDDVLSTTGTMSLTDLDLNDPANATRISVKVTGFDGGFDDTYFLGMLKLSTETYQNGDPLRVNEPHNVRWTFESLAQDDFDYLVQDEVLKLEYTIEVKDSLGATSQQVVAVSITGTNDAPQVFVWDGDSASGSILSPTQDVTGSLSIFDEDVVTAYFAGVKFDGVQITDTTLQSSLYSLLLIDPTSTYKTVNEPNNFDWRFNTTDAFAKGLTSGLSAGEHQLTYTMDFVDIYSAEHKQDINILFTV